MANTGRKIGINIFTLMQNAGISREGLAEKLDYSYREMMLKLMFVKKLASFM